MAERQIRLLAEGDTIGIVSPSGAVGHDIIARAVAELKAAGYGVKMMPHVEGCATGVFSATDAERATDLQMAIEAPDIAVVMCARGGYGAVRTLQALPPHVLQQCDKWVVGFSDITALHQTLTSMGVPSMHGPMLKHIAQHGMRSQDVETMFDLMKGRSAMVETTANPLNRKGEAAGRLTGGNLSIIYSLRSTPADLMPDRAVLFIEDLAEYRYHIDRMMQNLRYSGVLSRLSGLIVGQFTDQKDGATPFGLDAYHIIAEAVAGYSYPVLFGYPAGHAQEINMPLVMGREVKLTVTDRGGMVVM